MPNVYFGASLPVKLERIKSLPILYIRYEAAIIRASPTSIDTFTSPIEWFSMETLSILMVNSQTATRDLMY